MSKEYQIKLWCKVRLFELMGGVGDNDAKTVLKELLDFIDNDPFAEPAPQAPELSKVERTGKECKEQLASDDLEKYVYTKFRIGDVIVEIKPNGYCQPVRVKYVGEGAYSCESDDRKRFLFFPVTSQDEYKLVEQKPADGQKFKVGDWLVHKDKVGVICCITQIHAPHYYLTNNNSFIKFGEEDNYRPWTIQDAKAGDVLVDVCDSLDNPLIFILKDCKHIKHELATLSDYHSFCYLKASKKQKFCIDGWHNEHNLMPATKEQRNLLFQKIHEAGYEWDAEKLELKKVEQKSVKVPKFKVGDFIQFKGMGHTRYTVKEVCGLSHYINTCNKRMDMSYTDANFELVEQKPAEWSEEDETGLADTMWAVKQARTITKDENDMGNLWYAERWLKSLKDRYTWKPSDEQITVLHDVATYIDNSIYPNQKDVLVNLYLQLKKLREE